MSDFVRSCYANLIHQADHFWYFISESMMPMFTRKIREKRGHQIGRARRLKFNYKSYATVSSQTRIVSNIRQMDRRIIIRVQRSFCKVQRISIIGGLNHDRIYRWDRVCRLCRVKWDILIGHDTTAVSFSEASPTIKSCMRTRVGPRGADVILENRRMSGSQQPVGTQYVRWFHRWMMMLAQRHTDFTRNSAVIWSNA